MPLDANIAMGYKPIKIESPVNQLAYALQVQGAQQANQMNSMKMQAEQAASDRHNKLYSMLGGLPQGATNDDRINALRSSGYLDEADKVEKGVLERRKTESEATGKDTETENKVISVYRDLAGMAKDPATAAEYIKAMHSDPRLKNTAIARVPLYQALGQIGQDPESFNSWKQQFGLGAAKFIEMNKPTQTVLNNGGTNQVIQTPGMGGAPQTMISAPITESANNISNNERIAREGTLNRGVQVRGQNMTDARQKDRLELDKTKPATTKTGPMSVTLQKELLESDDAVQAGKSIVSTLQNALKINNDAYSGYAAKARAVLASNVPFIGKNGANATIDLDNMMTGQALDSLKTVFGGMPTEGERKILLDMQASADKTPTQREAIINRAISAAERRLSYAAQKAKAIRSGQYLSQGVDDSAQADPLDALLKKYE